MSSPHGLRAHQKRQLFEEWMAGDDVLLHFDARAEGVEVPAHLAGNPSLTLKLSYLFQGSTTHDSERVVAFLRFSGAYRECIIPWSAVWGMTSGDGKHQLWADDMPREVVLETAQSKIRALTAKLLPQAAKRAAPSAADASPDDDTPPEPPEPQKPSRQPPALRRIK